MLAKASFNPTGLFAMCQRMARVPFTKYYRQRKEETETRHQHARSIVNSRAAPACLQEVSGINVKDGSRIENPVPSQSLATFVRVRLFKDIEYVFTCHGGTKIGRLLFQNKIGRRNQIIIVTLLSRHGPCWLWGNHSP
jgi:hypothetical protein